MPNDLKKLPPKRAPSVAGHAAELARLDHMQAVDDVGAAATQDLAESLLSISSAENPPRDEPSWVQLAETSLPGSAASEIELKLLVDNDLLSKFNDAPIIAANARNKGTRKRLRSVYYDTPERTLWHNGLSLRVRQNGARFIQTMKGEVGNDPLRRGEWEAAVPSLIPNIALAMPFIPDKLRADIEGQKLEPVFFTDIRRHQRVVDLPSGIIEVSFDQGFLRSGSRSMPVAEVELELKAGSPSAVYEIALRLAEHGAVRPSIRSKAARGFDLAGDTAPGVGKPQKFRLDPPINLDDAFSAILRSCLHHLLEALPAAEDGRDPEGIHQVRVALRRLRSALDLMRPVGSLSMLELLRADAKWLGQSVSAARDLDIFQMETLPVVAHGCPLIAGFDALGRVTEERRSAAYRKARLALTDRQCAHFIINLGSWIEARGWRNNVNSESLGQLAEPAETFARQILSHQFAKVLKRGRHFKSQTTDERHRLRLALKKMRYVANFFLPLCGERKTVKKFNSQLANLQEELGAYNDMATTATLLATLGEEAPDSGGAAAAIAGWQAHAMFGTEHRLRRAWRDFAKTKQPWLPDVSN